MISNDIPILERPVNVSGLVPALIIRVYVFIRVLEFIGYQNRMRVATG